MSMNEDTQLYKLFDDLIERAKELNCLYKVQELFSDQTLQIEQVIDGILQSIPPGWQFPDVCEAKIVFQGKVYKTLEFEETKWCLSAPVKIQDEFLGEISVYYLEERPHIDEGPFLKEERKLINTIAEQFGFYLLNRRLRSVFEEKQIVGKEQKNEWEIILELLEKTDSKLFIRVSRKMVTYLCLLGLKETEQLLEFFNPLVAKESEWVKEVNKPGEKVPREDIISLSRKTFNIARDYLSKGEILENIQKWIKEDQSGFLADILNDSGSSLSDITRALDRYHHLTPKGLELSMSRQISFQVELIRRLLTDDIYFINIAKKFLEIEDFGELLHKTIFPGNSHGRLGGKSSGLLLAKHILKKNENDHELLKEVKTPKTWYLTSDTLLNFMVYNKLEDVIEQKYKDIGQIRQEYPYVVHVFKNSLFDPEIIKGLSLALDDFGEVPLVVRSSSLLEDRLGMSFAGKYKSLFIANQGDKKKRLNELTDAIAEVYASIFSPDPVEYRLERNLIDYHEEMGIMIQEVIGQKVGPYFFPSFAGVAFSYNEYRWSPRLKREDGLLRMVPGLGTSAVDRTSKDYPVLIAPGQPDLRVNVSLEEIIRYSPKVFDVINLETGSFESVDFFEVIRNYGASYPCINKIVSIINDNYLQSPRPIGVDYSKEDVVVTFNGLVAKTDFVKQVDSMLKVLQENYGHPVDIEFAHDGKDLYLLQCRSQSATRNIAPKPLPVNISSADIVFSATRYVSNGFVPSITHIVYVDPEAYAKVENYDELVKIGRAVGRLNKILPKQQFILMGPGRWGSRGDIKLGVNVSYADISNSAILIEIAKKNNNYVPDLSFGTHFFLDLVEANIRYLPLYPDDEGVFNVDFFTLSANILVDILPGYEHLSDTVKVIDVKQATDGKILQVYMNGQKDEAVAVLMEEQINPESENDDLNGEELQNHEAHWHWRLREVESIAAQLDPDRFGVKGYYVFGSTKNATAGPASDIDILIHFTGNEKQKHELNVWLEGWSLSLSQINYLKTGYKTGGLLDVHIITDEDIKNRTSYAVKIGAVSDAARPLAIGTEIKTQSD
jgi:pyruvate,water dikinase